MVEVSAIKSVVLFSGKTKEINPNIQLAKKLGSIKEFFGKQSCLRRETSNGRAFARGLFQLVEIDITIVVARGVLLEVLFYVFQQVFIVDGAGWCFLQRSLNDLVL
ncbi:hypothetical protein AA957_01910 [Pseudomonas trivialis]|uniref:Uncharacterized protein n=1 Tax=Pseudomonas trivialis TaxID=200450 RepID=A0A0H5A278_9PSED|nr:hypothetical protein AA957_01910 [Pseudomonas trivialis]